MLSFQDDQAASAISIQKHMNDMAATFSHLDKLKVAGDGMKRSGISSVSLSTYCPTALSAGTKSEAGLPSMFSAGTKSEAGLQPVKLETQE